MSINYQKLGDILTIERGGSPRPIKKYLTDDKDGLNWIKIGDASASNKYIYETKEKITKDGLYKTRFVNIGDFILSNSMSFGRPYIMKTTGCIHDGWLVLKGIDEANLDRDFLYYILCSPNIFKQFDNLAAGSTVRNLNIGLVSSVEVPTPKIEQQKQIVEILDKAFEAIDKAKENIEKNIQNSKELFQSRLNEIFSQKGEDWEVKTLGDVCNLFQGLAINQKTKHLLVEKSSLPLLRIKDLKNNIEEQYISEIGCPEKSKVNKNEIIYTRTGSLGLVFRNREGVLHNNSFKVIPNKELENDYLFYWLQHGNFNKKIIKLASKAAQPDITHKLFKEQIIIIPPKIVQKQSYLEIVELEKQINQLEEKYQQKLENLEELKKSILQKAFSGELI